jgi:uncharacterized damage-inducible protein DinB
MLDDLLEVLLDSWDRNNTILVNLLRAVPNGGLEVKAMDGSPSVAQMFMHIHYVRLIFVSEDAPEFTDKIRRVSGETSATRIKSPRCSTRVPRRCVLL